MRNKILFTVMSLLLYCMPVQAYVYSPTIDNCASTNGGSWFGQIGQGCGTSFFQGDSVAYQFFLDTPVYVSSIEAWIAYNDVDLNTKAGANVAIYNATAGNEHTGPIPMISEKIFSKNFSFAVDPHSSSPAEWRGINDFSIDLQPGSYWIAFEEGTRGAFVNGSQGIRMEAIHNPEPMTMATMGGGLLYGIWRRRKNAVKI